MTVVLPRTYLPADPDRKCPLLPIPALDDRHLAVEVRAWSVEDLVRVAVLGGVEAIGEGMRMRRPAVVRMHVRGHRCPK